MLSDHGLCRTVEHCRDPVGRAIIRYAFRIDWMTVLENIRLKRGYLALPGDMNETLGNPVRAECRAIRRPGVLRPVSP